MTQPRRAESSRFRPGRQHVRSSQAPTNKPVSPSVTNSGMPPASVPITATPHACASRTLSPNGSAVDRVDDHVERAEDSGDLIDGTDERDAVAEQVCPLRPQVRLVGTLV